MNRKAAHAILALSATGEALTGLLLLASPSWVTGWLFGAEVGGAGAIMSRVAGVALISLGAACWPRGALRQALAGMMIYSGLVTVVLAWTGFGSGMTGKLLWPAVAAHLGLTALLTWAWSAWRKADGDEVIPQPGSQPDSQGIP